MGVRRGELGGGYLYYMHIEVVRRQNMAEGEDRWGLYYIHKL